MLKKTIGALAVLLVAGATVVAADVDLKKVKCVISDKPASESKTADYKDGKVYFCCGGCAGKFAKDTKKFAAKANHQLVATKQYEQKGCPMSGGKLNPETMVKLAGTELGFCCNKCKGAFEGKADDKEKLELVFNDKAFEKAFQKVKKEDAQN
jgi:YHS domain-containing protein